MLGHTIFIELIIRLMHFMCAGRGGESAGTGPLSR